MSTIAGWYPDPAGSADLRWWDGQVWTSAVTEAAAAAASAAVPMQTLPRPASAVIPAQYQRASIVRPYARPRKPWYRRRAFVVSVSGVAALGVLLVVGAVGVVLSENHDARSLEARTTIAMPETVAGIPQIHTALADTVTARYNKPPIRPHLTGTFATSTQLAAEVDVERLTTARSRIPDVLAGFEKGAREDGTGFAFTPVDAGPLGGRMACASVVVQGSAVKSCVFVDSATIGSVMLYGRYATDPALPLEFRAAIEIRR